MQRKLMDVIIGLLYAVGLLLIGIAATVYWGNGSPTLSLWTLVGGLIWTVLTGAFHTQLFISEANKAHSEDAKPPQYEIDRQRAYVIVEASELRNAGKSDAPIEGWVSLKNTGLTPALELRRIARIFATKYPFDGFDPIPLGDARGVLGPGNAVDFGPMRMSGILSAEQKLAVSKGEMAIYVYGRVEYFDVFRIKRCTNFRLIFRDNMIGIGDGVLPLQQLPDGNNFDCQD
jgi:hypothetical protein